MSQKIYTKTGDEGKTSLIGGTKVPKNNIRIESYGTIDELNSWLGMVGDYIANEDIKTVLKQIQDRLFIIGSSLACDPEKNTLMKLPLLEESDVDYLENEIDSMTAVLPVMKNFVLPGGSLSVSSAHIARCVCRRAERVCVNMQQQDMFVEPLIIKYLNRLSDYLFTLARYIAHIWGITEVVWKPKL